MFAGAGIVPLGPIVNLSLFSVIAWRAFRGAGRPNVAESRS